MDYDKTTLAATFDRGREHGPEMLQLWMEALARHLEGRQPATMLDLGCGTGRFSNALARHFDATVVAIDPAATMLERAREKPTDRRVRYEQAPGEAIPLETASVDVVFMSMSFHHFNDPPRAAAECRRVTRAGGTIFVRTGTVEQIGAYAYVPFMPSSRAIIENLLPDAPRLRSLFGAAGFACVARETVTQTIAPNWLAYVAKIEAGGDSVLAQIDPLELAAGFAAMRARSSDVGDAPVTEPIDLFVFR